MHSLGVQHTHQRPDRDDHVTIIWDNVNPGLRYAFKKDMNLMTYNVPYNGMSMMHYPTKAFPIEKNKPTIVSKVCRNLVLLY